ncbi:hypothetical protein LJC63_11400 [Ruminococcaceae bacterium OttesenSCG-928-L11]|nr:hypothetical protein [Ruminococcaceae bacterium OttesenSCG-928-L11]
MQKEACQSTASSFSVKICPRCMPAHHFAHYPVIRKNFPFFPLPSGDQADASSASPDYALQLAYKNGKI